MSFNIESPLMKAGLSRANRLSKESLLSDETRSFWVGYAKALGDLCDGTLARLAAKDAALQQVQAGAQGAGSGLAVSIEGLAVVGKHQPLTTEAAQVAPDALTNGNVNAAEQLKNGVLASVVNLDDEHAAHHVGVGDGTCEHGGSVDQEVAE